MNTCCKMPAIPVPAQFMSSSIPFFYMVALPVFETVIMFLLS